VKEVKTYSRTRNGVILSVVVFASIFAVSYMMFKPKPATESKNARFNDWVTYFRGKEGHTVEYLDFASFRDESDFSVGRQANVLADDIELVKVLMGSVLVFFDWEKDTIFFRGTGSDSTKLYCYYCTF
jgi:hypothetical protein